MNRLISAIIFILCLFSTGASLLAQSYFRAINQPQSGYYQRIERFPNGDVLIGDVSGSLQLPGLPNGFLLVRLDACGEVLWQRNYRERSRHLTFDQIAIDDSGKIYVFGSALVGTKEEVFILKLAEDGSILANRLLDGAISDNFTYSLVYREGKLMTFGALADAGNPERSHLMVLDTNLNLLLSRQFEPFEAYGEGIALRKGAFLLVNGLTVMQVDSLGTLNWARQLAGFPSYVSTSIPIEVPGGTVHAVYFSGYTWFFKIDSTGSLEWESDRFPAYHHLPEMELLPGGGVLAIYNDGGMGGNHPVQLRLAPDGEIMSQHRLQVNYPIHTGYVGLTLHDDRRLNLLGNIDLGISSGILRSDFVLQLDLIDPDPDCFAFVPFSDAEPNGFGMALLPATVAESDAPMVESQLLEFMDTSIAVVFTEICAFEPYDREVTHDTTLPCGAEWTIAIPGPEYSWADGHASPARTVTEAGSWEARHTDCSGSTSHVFALQQPDCDCLQEIPNAFSPNQDGVNDALILQSNCDLDAPQISVFDRWGHAVFSSTGLPAVWDGKHRGRPVPEGVYYLVIRAIGRGAGGKIHPIDYAQNLTLIR